MRYVTPGQRRSLEELAEHWRAIDPTLDVLDPASLARNPLAEPITLFGRRVGNRFAIHPMEGWDGTAEGLPTEHTRRRWRRFGQSGAKLIWGGEALAVQADGRANARQLYHNRALDMAAALRELREEIVSGHRESGFSTGDLVIGLQLTHSGRFSHPEGRAAPRVAYRHPGLDARTGVTSETAVLSDAELEAIGESFVEVARLAGSAGFDFVDVKACHGYLLHELLSARDRRGRYGGDLGGRTRLLRDILADIRRECPALGIGVRVSVSDAPPFERDPDTGAGRPSRFEGDRPYRWGFGVESDDPLQPCFEEPIALLHLLEEAGVEAINVSLGSPYYSPHLLRPAAYPPSDGYLPPEDPLRTVARHLISVRRLKQAVPSLRYVGSGYTYLMQHLPAVAAFEIGQGHADLVGIGRMVLTYPELIADHLAGRPLERKRICRTFSDCTTGPRNDMISGCYPLDPYYRELPEARRVREIRGGMPR